MSDAEDISRIARRGKSAGAEVDGLGVMQPTGRVDRRTAAAEYVHSTKMYSTW